MSLRKPGTAGTVTSRSSLEGHEGNKPLQEWLESISLRMMRRIDAVGDEVQKLVDECGAVELDLKNTFNSFRCLSSTQFVENRVYEEDETESVRAVTPAKESQHSFAPTESYEDEILPRYKDAVSTAWSTFQEISHQHDQASRRLRSRNKVLRNLDYDGRLHLIPHIIGTDEFARDIHCGLAELRHKRPVVDGFEVDSDTEREGADLAAELVGTESVSDGEWSEAESDIGDQGGGFEPAVSAALDFKAMLEAALRNPSLPYDGNSSTQTMDKYGQDSSTDYFVSGAAIDNYYGSPRNIPRTVGSGDHRAGDTSANTDASDCSSSWRLTDGHIPGDVAVQSTADSLGVSSSLSSQPGRVEQPLRVTMEKLLKNSFILKSENATKEETQNSSDPNLQLHYSGLANIPFIPGELFDDDEEDTVSITSDPVSVHDSNTEPTVPEELFQRKQSSGVSEHTGLESRGSRTLDLRQSKSPALEPSFRTIRDLPKQDLNVLSECAESKRSVKPTISEPSSSNENRENISNRLETSNGFKGQMTSKLTVPVQVRGGLFDDSDDEDAGDLFGKSLSIKVADAGINSEPVSRTWASVSSKGLFEDLEDEVGAQETLPPNPSGSSRERRKDDDLSFFLRQGSSTEKDDGKLRQRDPSWTTNSESTSESFQEHASSLSPSGNTFKRSQNQIPPSSPGGTTPASTGILSSTSSLSQSSQRFTDAMQKQSRNYSLSRDTENRTQQQFSDSYMSGASSDSPEKGLLGSFVDSTLNRPSASSLVVSVPEQTKQTERADKDPSALKVDSHVDGAKEETAEPHVNLESLLAAGIRPTARTVVYSSDDSDSWSSSGSDGDNDTSVLGNSNSQKSRKVFQTSTEDLESNHGETPGSKFDGNKPAAEATTEHNGSASAESPKVLESEQMIFKASSSVRSQGASSTSSTPRPGRTMSDTLVVEKPEEQKSVKTLSSVLEPTRSRFPLVEETAQHGAGTPSNKDGAEKLTHTTMSRPLGPGKRSVPSPSHSLRSAQTLPLRDSPRQSQPPPRNLSQNVILRSDLSAPVNDVGWLSTGRAFTSLFDEDDGEDDLFGADSPEKKSGARFGLKSRERESWDKYTDLGNRKLDEAKGLHSPEKSRSLFDPLQSRERDQDKKPVSPSKSMALVDPFSTRRPDEAKDVASPARSKALDFNWDESRGRDEAKESPSSTMTLSPLPSRFATTSPVRIFDAKVADGEQPPGRSASKLSSLLFGDDDDDNEDALFGPLREKSARGTSDWLVQSGNRTTSTRRTSSGSLFDD